jgi:O-methyltransferase involved in polyketide biosynthesis
MRLKEALFIACGTFFICDGAFAYVDPGAGHLLWQALLAAFAGGFFFFKRFLSFFPGRKQSRTDQE